MNIEKIGQNLQGILTARRMPQAELSRKTGIAPGTIKHHFDTGKMDVSYLARYAEALGCTIADLTDEATDLTVFTLKPDITELYPWNIAYALMNTGAFSNPDYEPWDVYLPGLLKSIGELTEREQEIISLRFEHGLTYEQCGYRYNVTRERIRQVEQKALRKLRHPRYSKLWRLDTTMNQVIEAKEEVSRLVLENIGLRDRLKALGETEETIPELSKLEHKDIGIDELELSVRSYNCLARAGIRTVSDMEGWTMEQFMRVRNLGRKSMMEIIGKLKDFGIEIKLEGEP